MLFLVPAISQTHKSLENSRDFFVKTKTKTKTLFFVLEAPRDQDFGLEDYITADYYRAEARRYLPDRAKTEAETMKQSRGRGSKVETEARPCEAEARPSQLKKTASRPPRAEADASRTTSLAKWHRRICTCDMSGH